MTLLRSSGIEAERIAPVEPTRSQNMTVSCRRSASVDRAAETEARVGPRFIRGIGGQGRCCFRFQGRDRRKQFAAVTDRGHADADQVVGRQLRKHFAIDIVVAETGACIVEPQAAQPRRNVHQWILRLREAVALFDNDRPLPFKLPAAALK